ncbi:MAG: ribosome biogenesis GTP-binding protein YihA/YsxC [Candidatus Gastranaerophilales bacterium]|nr:ribosome biogenesis GTP-binding protein YihA/YsxC [Candidatus Gastranaerophilales bacterium]
MKIYKAEFIKSADCLKNCPDFNLPEIAMIGRSNVGKSSFINAICNRKKLAKTSNTPGKTRLINLYNINDKLIIADLPGYGYAKVSQSEQNRWRKILEEYLLNRDSLNCIIQLIDSRHDVQNNDLQMREWLEHNKIKIITIATKTDTLTKNQKVKQVNSIKKALNADVIAFSAKNQEGTKEIHTILNSIVKE